MCLFSRGEVVGSGGCRGMWQSSYGSGIRCGCMEGMHEGGHGGSGGVRWGRKKAGAGSRSGEVLRQEAGGWGKGSG